MSLPVPLTVRVSSRSDSRTITATIDSLNFRWTDPGGYASCTVQLSRPLSESYQDLDYFSTITISDARNGAVVWEGRLEDPSRTAGQQGEVWNLAAIGGQSHANDVVKPTLYVNSGVTGFFRVENLAPSAQDSVAEDPGGSGKDALILRFPQGTTVSNNLMAVMRNDTLRDMGRSIALVQYMWDAGVSDGNYRLWTVIAHQPAGFTGADHPLTTAGSTTPVTIWQNQHFPAGLYRLEFKLRRNAGGTVQVPNDNVWVSIRDLVYVAARTDRHGAPIGGYGPYVLAHDVIEDLLYQLPQFDRSRANVDPGAQTAITQLAYVDGADAATILTDLMTLEGGYTWRVWERDPRSGKYVFEWVPVPVAVRYEADIIDGYESTASSATVYNSVYVRWKDAKGANRSTIVNGTSPTLDAAGLKRQGFLDLGDEMGTEDAAVNAGRQWLLDRANPANAGRLTIARPIQDLESGRMVQPWEIRPGLIRVRGVLPRPDAINTNTRDGTSVFRIVACEYDAARAAGTLELDSYPPSLAHLIAGLQDRSSGGGGKRIDWLNRPTPRKR